MFASSLCTALSRIVRTNFPNTVLVFTEVALDVCSMSWVCLIVGCNNPFRHAWSESVVETSHLAARFCGQLLFGGVRNRIRPTRYPDSIRARCRTPSSQREETEYGPGCTH